jgi:hypothetical protein
MARSRSETERRTSDAHRTSARRYTERHQPSAPFGAWVSAASVRYKDPERPRLAVSCGAEQTHASLQVVIAAFRPRFARLALLVDGSIRPATAPVVQRISLPRREGECQVVRASEVEFGSPEVQGQAVLSAKGRVSLQAG